jgi:hypothetical protein
VPDSPESSMQVLADLLSGYATPIVDKSRVVPSSTYDFDYRALLVGFAFQMHAKSWRGSVRQLGTARLKLMQFIAQRPWLLGIVREWGDNRKDAYMSMLAHQRFRRGYVSDPLFDRVVDFLVADHVLVRTATHLIEGPHFSRLQSRLNAAQEANLFENECDVLREFSSITVTNSMLEGS